MTSPTQTSCVPSAGGARPVHHPTSVVKGVLMPWARENDSWSVQLPDVPGRVRNTQAAGELSVAFWPQVTLMPV